MPADLHNAILNVFTHESVAVELSNVMISICANSYVSMHVCGYSTYISLFF